MQDEIVLKACNVSKKFCKTTKHLMLYGGLDIFRDFFQIKTNSSKLRKNEFWALKNINFEIKKGDALALIGPNGSGKSTLLRMINGIFMPDIGQIAVKGHVSALIAVGAGFHPQLTGRENIYVNAQILGLSNKEINNRINGIIDFSDIGDFLDAPVKHYSSGMLVRLGFSIAVHAISDILLIDEILAVGDADFQYKCYEKIKEIKNKGITIIVVSHNLSSLKYICEKGLFIYKGEQKAFGDIDDIIKEYSKLSTKVININSLLENTKDLKAIPVEGDTSIRRGNGKARFIEVNFTNELGGIINKVPFGTERIQIRTKYYAIEKILNVRIVFEMINVIKGRIRVLGGPITASRIEHLEGAGELIYDIDIKYLSPGKYGLYIAMTDHQIWDLVYDLWDINDTFIEIETNAEILETGLGFTPPVMLQDAKLFHRSNET